MSVYRGQLRTPPPALDESGHYPTCYSEDGETLVRCEVNRCRDARARKAFSESLERRHRKP